MSAPWPLGHKYGKGKCPDCGRDRALDARGRLQKHTTWTEYTDLVNYKIHCSGSYKRPLKTKEE